MTLVLPSGLFSPVWTATFFANRFFWTSERSDDLSHGSHRPSSQAGRYTALLTPCLFRFLLLFFPLFFLAPFLADFFVEFVESLIFATFFL